MRACETWLETREIKTIGYLNHDQPSFDRGAKAGWKAALEWVKRESNCCGDPTLKYPECGCLEIINQELGE